METDMKIRKQVTFGQLKALIDFLREHQELAKGLTRGRRGKLHTLKLWNLCAKKLNVFKDGAIKDGKAWSKYWCDWKYRVRRRALELKAARDGNRAPPEGVTPLSAMEENILSIIGEAAVDSIVIKSDPLADEASEEEELDNNEENSSINQGYAAEPPTKTRKRRNSSRELSDLDDHGPSGSEDNKPDVALRNGVESDEAAEFLRLEKEKIENARKLHETVLTLTSEITRLTDIMSHIRDVIVNNRINL